MSTTINVMPSERSSRIRFDRYRDKLKAGKGEPDATISTAASHGHGHHHAAHRGGKKKPLSRSFFRLFREFWALLAGHRALLLATLVGLTFSTVVGLAPLYGTKVVFDSVLRENPLPSRLPPWLHAPAGRHQLLTFVVVTMVILASVSELVGLWGRWQATRMTKRVQVGVRRRVFDHAVRLPLHRVYELKSGGVASILREDAGGVADLIFSMIYNPWRAVTQLLGSLIILAFVNWHLLLGAFAIIPIIWMTHRTWIARIRPVYRAIRSTRQGIDSQATEAFSGMRVVRSFSRQRYESGSFTRNGHLMARQEILAWWRTRWVEVAWSVMIPLGTALLVYFGGGRVLSDMERVRAGTLAPSQALTVGDLVMFMTYLGALLGPLGALASTAMALQNNLAGLDRVLDLLAEPTEMPALPGAITIDRANVRGHLSFSDVSFAYASSKTPVLEGINLEVRPGEMIALVGPSGAGKTTLCNLVARFYDPTQGAVRLDGVDLRDITADSYRKLLGIVEQDTFLFDGTIADNISYGQRDATPDQIAWAATQANAHEFISAMPLGYQTLIGERGVKLSGGQRQRLTIARAILADPRILILDEATSNLDTDSERLIQNSLAALMADRTSFVIAHRLSTIRHADRILVVEGGRIVEQGTHDELIAASGRYRDMVELQTSSPASPVPAERLPNASRRETLAPTPSIASIRTAS